VCHIENFTTELRLYNFKIIALKNFCLKIGILGFIYILAYILHVKFAERKTTPKILIVHIF
jgi:hypothetical protein